MMVSERERNGYAANYDYEASRSDRYSRYDYERAYEEDRVRTSESYRDSLMSSLERPAMRSRLERADESRYGFYMANINAGENNYDKFWDEKQKKSEKQNASSSKKRLAFMVTYMVIALVAVIAVTLSVVGTSGKTAVVTKTFEGENMMASAEPNVQTVALTESAAEEEKEAPVVVGGENYILLANGEAVEVVLPERAVKAKEEENKFDKFCTWLNGVFGG